MENNLYSIMVFINISFLIIWGAYERISAVRKEKKSSASGSRDRKSLLLLYASIFSGYGIGIPVIYSGYGNISFFFPFISFAGFLIIITGLVIRMIAIRTLAEQFTYKVKIISDHRLITDGIYGYIRHPSYLGQILIFFGAGLAFSNWISLLFLFIPVLASTAYRISIEEKVLTGHFKNEYADYIRRSKRLIPFIY